MLASSTSAVTASQFTEALSRRARCLVAHPVNPPHLVPVVELCGAPWTSAATIERAKSVMAEKGQVPVVVRRELDGFILNRLQGRCCLKRCASWVRATCRPRTWTRRSRRPGLGWSFMGPFATIELNAPGGVADYCARYGGFYRSLAADPRTGRLGRGHVARVVAALGKAPTPAEREAKTSARDRRLLALARHKRDQSDT